MAEGRVCFSSGTVWESATGYSRVVRAGGLLFTAGTVAADLDGTIQGKSCYEQCIYIFRKLDDYLAAAGSSLDEVVKVTCFLTDLADADDFCRAHSELLGNARPAATCVQVSAMFGAGAKAEIELIAVAGSAHQDVLN